MKYQLHGRFSSGSEEVVDITEQQFLNLQNARNELILYTEWEELWDCVIQNYIELELTFLKEGLRSMILNDSYEAFHTTRLHFARRLSNHLSSSRSYLDRSSSIMTLLPIVDGKAAFNSLTAKAYDKYLGYRVMHALRNHAQHGGLPVHGSTFGRRWTNHDNDGVPQLLEYSVAGRISIEELKLNNKFKKKILSEIDNGKKYIDLAPLSREHVEGLGAVHEELRKRFSNKIDRALSIFGLTGLDIKWASEKTPVFTQAVRSNSEGHFEDEFYVATDIFEHLKRMQRRNGSMVNYSLRKLTTRRHD